MMHDRVHVIGSSPYEHERAAIDFLAHALPDTPPYRLWALFDLVEPQNGALYEVDALVIGYQAVYLIEIKSYTGTIAGDDADWAWTPYDDPGRVVWVRNPLSATNHKCKVLASQLKRVFPRTLTVPRVEALVFLSAETDRLKLRLDERGRVRVVTRDNVLRAITRHEYPGAVQKEGQRINAPVASALTDALAKVGVRPRKRRMRAGQYELGALLDAGPGFQDREATHVELGDKRAAVARTFLVSDQVSDERRRKLHAAAKREFSLLLDIGRHEGIVEPVELIADAELGPTLLLKDYRQSRPLTQLLRAEPSVENVPPLSFDDRAHILLQVARALAYCHARGVRHGALSPDAVLIDHQPPGSPVARLRNFFLGASAEVTGTVLSTQLLASAWQLYQAPECVRGAEPSEAADVFSLGALAYHLLVGRPAASNVVEQLRHLHTAQYLDVLAATDSVDDELAALVVDATVYSPADRELSAEQFANRLEEVLTRPTAVAISASRDEPDPLLARKDDVIDGRYRVEGVRGQGASARVLEVRDEQSGRTLALKIALDDDHNPRLVAEGELLATLEHSRIVRFDRSFVVAGRRCLTMTLAGVRSLADALREEGTPSLDFARRYGDELLDALTYLELDAQKLHRDIKPANLGVGALGKQAHHLTLFDFSLASAPLDAVTIGTAAYRDPMLELGRRWDYAADRYAAAVTLYEMLTGVRPDHADVTRPVSIDADRFDPSAKDGLAHFFRTAFERDVEARHPSAEEMRRQWTSAFDERVNLLLVSQRGSAGERVQRTDYDDAELATLPLETPVEQLRLTPAAKSALGRAGIFRGVDLLSLPKNRLAAMRGVGRAVSKEILTLRERWEALRPSGLNAVAPFLASYEAEPQTLASDVLGLSEQAQQVLEDAGLTDTRGLAAAPSAQVEALLARADTRAGEVRQRLDAQTRTAEAEGQSLRGLVDDFLGGKSKAVQQVRVWWGLAAPLEGQLAVTAAEAAAVLETKAAALYLQLAQLRDKWAGHAHRDALEERVEQVARSVQRIAPLGQVAEALAIELGAPDLESARTRAEAAALIRVVVEVQREEDEAAGLRLLRTPSGGLWLADADDTLDVLRALGDRADLIANRTPLASPAATLRELFAVLPEGGEGAARLAGIGDVRLLQLAAAWSKTAAVSARLELYPRDLEPARALALSVTALDRDPTIDDIKRRVTGRFPSVVLPEGEALDALLGAQGFEWSPEQQCYMRPSAGGVSDPGTRLQPTVSKNVESAAALAEVAVIPQPASERPPTGGVPSRPLPTVRRESELARSLRTVRDRGGMRVLTVSAKSLGDAERALAKYLGTEVVALDQALSRAMHALAPADSEVIYEIDATGPLDAGGKVNEEWRDLTALAKKASEQVADTLCRGAGVKLLSRPGLCARYELDGLLSRLRDYADGDARASVLLLVPTVGGAGGVPRIEERFPIPGLPPHAVLRLRRQDLASL